MAKLPQTPLRAFGGYTVITIEEQRELIRNAYEAANKELNDKINELREQLNTVEKDYRQHMDQLAATCLTRHGCHDLGSEMMGSRCKRCSAYPK